MMPPLRCLRWPAYICFRRRRMLYAIMMLSLPLCRAFRFRHCFHYFRRFALHWLFRWYIIDELPGWFSDDSLFSPVAYYFHIAADIFLFLRYVILLFLCCCVYACFASHIATPCRLISLIFHVAAMIDDAIDWPFITLSHYAAADMSALSPMLILFRHIIWYADIITPLFSLLFRFRCHFASMLIELPCHYWCHYCHLRLLILIHAYLILRFSFSPLCYAIIWYLRWLPID